MALESGTYIDDLVGTNPVSADDLVRYGADHLRLLKNTIKASFAGFTDAVCVTGVDGGAANVYTLTPATPLPSYGPRMIIVFSPAVANTGAVTINVSSLGAKSVKSVSGAALVSGDLVVNVIYVAVYNGTDFQLTAPTKNYIDLLDLAQKDYIDQIVFTSELPSQGGNANKYVRTNGTAASWQYAGMELADPAGATLTNKTTYQAFIANAAYTLPDFTNSKTFGLASLSNSPAVPATVTTSDGWTIAPDLAVNTFKAISPLSTATAHGAWGNILMTPAIFGSITAASAPTILGVAALSSTLNVILYGVSSNTTMYVVAINPTTGACGSPLSLGTTTNVQPHIFADSATTFVVGFDNGSGASVIAGTVSTLSITVGSVVNGTYSYFDLIQLAQGLYLHSSSNAQVEAFSVSGTVVQKGNNLNTGTSKALIVKINATQALAVGCTTTSPAQMQAVVITVTGSTSAAGTVYSAATSVVHNGGVVPRFLKSLSNGSYVACFENQSPTTTGDYYAMTVSGTVVTIGTVLQIANSLPSAAYPLTYAYPAATDTSQRVVVYSSNQLLVGLSDGAIALSVTGTTITNGSKFGTASTKFVTDAQTGLNFYAVTSTTIDKITVATTIISSSYQLAASPVIVAADTMNDKAVSYSGTWYTWTLPTMNHALTYNKWLSVNSSDIRLYGEIS